MHGAEPGLREVVLALEGCEGPAEIATRLGSVLARRSRLREFWWIDPERAVLHARAGGVLLLEERSLASLDPGSSSLVGAACEAPGACVIEGETTDSGGEALKVVLLAVPLRRKKKLLGVLGLLSVRSDSFPPALVAELDALAAPLAQAIERSGLPRNRDYREAGIGPADSLAAYGRVAAAVAHEIRNPLAAMTHAVTLLRANPALGLDDHTLLDVLHEELGRVSRIAADFLSFAKPFMGRFSFVSIGALIDGTVLLLRRDPRVASKIEVTTAVEAGLPPVWLNADGIRQVLWNLCLNAVQALPCGGKISVSARALREGMRDGVCLEVCDDGPGIALERREHVFEPFETTNPNGTGLGLALVRSGIERHQGWVRIEDAPAGGTCVRFWLPVSSDEK